MKESRYTRQAAIYSRPLISASQPKGIKMDYGLPYLLPQYSLNKKCKERNIIRIRARISIVPGGFEPSSPAPKARRIDHYPTGLNPKSQLNYLFFMGTL